MEEEDCQIFLKSERKSAFKGYNRVKYPIGMNGEPSIGGARKRAFLTNRLELKACRLVNRKTTEFENKKPVHMTVACAQTL